MAQTDQSTGYEAYVINSDGTRTKAEVSYADSPSPFGASFPNGFAGAGSRPRAQGGPGSFGGFRASTTQSAYRQQPGSTPNAAGVKAAPKLHLGRRLAGLVVMAIGVPLLILPGPGLALIGIGAAMTFMP